MTLTDLARYDKGIVHNDTEVTPEGYIKGRAIVTRCGVFFYKNADGTIRRELRHPDNVREPESLESIKMIPVVDGHPPERLIKADNAKRLAVGYTGETVEDEPPYVIANFVITDKGMVEKIKNKKKNELSLGYTVDLIPEPGVYNGEPYDFMQTNIRYNHLAIVDEARAGPEARIALDGDDAELITKQEAEMSAKPVSGKKLRKIKIDAEEYMLEDDAAEHVEKMMSEKMGLEKQKEELERKIEELHNMIDRTSAERDSLRDKDYHDPKMVHEFPGKDMEKDNMTAMSPPKMPMAEKDEIGPKGKEEKDPIDTYGMQSHVRDYEKPSAMKEHVVEDPKNRHYPHDLPHIAKVDQAEFNRQVTERVRLIKLGERYLDKNTVLRLDSMSSLDIKKKLILNFQKNAVLDGKSEVYINSRFDSVLENLPREKPIAIPSRFDSNPEKSEADAASARLSMINRQKQVSRQRGK